MNHTEQTERERVWVFAQDIAAVIVRRFIPLERPYVVLPAEFPDHPNRNGLYTAPRQNMRGGRAEPDPHTIEYRANGREVTVGLVNTIAHELTHATQFEDDPEGFRRAFARRDYAAEAFLAFEGNARHMASRITCEMVEPLGTDGNLWSLV